MNMNVIFGMCLLAGLLGNIKAEEAKESVQVIDHPHKNEYASVVIGSEKHKYGYELKENRHFHHTTTEKDGVRLGCYGYEVFGKKYSTQYVADVKGYRPVYTHDLITVYPRSGGERKASFVGDFNEDQQRSENIRYFFPDGCKGIDMNILPIALPFPEPTPVVFKNPDPPIFPPKPPVTSNTIVVATPSTSVFEPPKEPETTTAQTTRASTTPRPTKPITSSMSQSTTTSATQKPIITTVPTQAPTTPSQSTTTPFQAPTTPKRPSKPLLTKIPVPDESRTTLTQRTPDTCENKCCSDDENVPKLVLPIALKTDGKSCGKFAKLVIPVEGLNPDSLRGLTKGADSSELIKTILQSLS